MAAHPMNLERKVRQLDNDVQSIYELLSAIQGLQMRQTNRLDEIDRSLESLSHHIDALEGRMDALERRMGGLEGRMDVMEGLLREVVELIRAR